MTFPLSPQRYLGLTQKVAQPPFGCRVSVGFRLLRRK